jgi:hypothetical protein
MRASAEAANDADAAKRNADAERSQYLPPPRP